MRKLLCMIAFTAILTATQAQTPFKYTTTNPTGAILNTSVDTMHYDMLKSYSDVTIQAVFTRATGTMAGTAILAYSAYSPTGPFVNTDTLTMANAATNTAIWNKHTGARYFRIIRSGATTVTGTSAAKLSVPSN